MCDAGCLGMDKINSKRGVGAGMNRSCHSMILTIQNNVMENAAVLGVYWVVLRL